MDLNEAEQDNSMKWLKQTQKDQIQKTATTIATTAMQNARNTTTRTGFVNGRNEQQEHYKSLTTTTVVKRPLNKFGLNIKNVSEKPFPEGSKFRSNVKTQIARLSYRKDCSNQNSARSPMKDLETEKVSAMEKKDGTPLPVNSMESSQSVQSLESFAKKKLERDEEIKEIQEMLNKIKSPQKNRSETSKNISQKPEAEEIKEKSIGNLAQSPFYRRSNTELQIKSKSIAADGKTKARISRKDSARSCSSAAINKPRSKSSQLPLSAKDSKSSRKIGYNPEDARRYIEMQKKQRKSVYLKESANKSKIEKEEIKKRLEELKKCTRKLVSKNLQNKEKIIAKNTLSKESQSRNQLKLKPQKSRAAEQTRETNLKNELEGLNLTHTFPLKGSNTERTKNSQKISEATSRSIQSLKSPSIPARFLSVQNHRRIGLLRKTENDKEFSLTRHKNYNFDKENQNLEILTKQLSQSKENKVTAQQPHNKENQKQVENTHTEGEEGKEEVVQAVAQDISEDNKHSDLEIAEHNLKSSKSEDIPLDSLISKEIPRKDSPKPHDLPYWLRPSMAQVYPYNFIMAVRRKLEAIAQPVDSRTMDKTTKHNQENATADLKCQLKQNKIKSVEESGEKSNKKFKRKQETNTSENKAIINNQQQTNNTEITALKELKLLPENKKINEYDAVERDLNNESISSSKKDAALQESIQSIGIYDKEFCCLQNKTKTSWPKTDIPLLKILQKSSGHDYLEQNSPRCKLVSNFKSIESLNSEINSNLSSISLQVPTSNTLTEVSSLKTESIRTFTHSKKLQQQNSEDELSSISSIIFSSPEKRLKHHKDFEFIKPRPVSPLSLEIVNKLKIQRKSTDLDDEKSDKEMYFTQLLEDFNRSLSQVIQVNEQLKCTLDKSQQILSPRSSKKSSDSEKHYSSDFEKSTSKTLSTEDTEKLKKSLKKSNENLEERKHKIFEIAEKVRPLLKPQKETQEVETLSAIDVNNPLPMLNLNINLKSLSNSLSTNDDQMQKTERGENDIHVDSSSSTTTSAYKERLDEIEKLKETLKQTILESKEKRREREECQKINEEENEIYRSDQIRNQNDSESEQIQIETTKSDKSKEVLINKSLHKSPDNHTGIETQREYTNTSNETSKHSYKEYKSFIKYQKKYKNYSKDPKEDLKISDSESYERTANKLLKIQDNENQKSSGSSEVICSEIHYLGNSLNQLYLNDQTIERNIHATFSKTNSKNNSNNDSYEKIHSSRNQDTKNSSRSNTQSLKPIERESESGSHSGTQSEMDNVARSENSIEPKSDVKTNHNDEAISSSIVEAIQNTFESRLQENKNVPINVKSTYKTNTSKRNYDRNDSSKFIISHINRSRGDFQETTFKEAHLNETQFQQAIEAASQISSTEFAQSADDEITSSTASKPYNNAGGSNPTSYRTTTVSKDQKTILTTTSPSKSNRRNSIGSEVVKFFAQYNYGRIQRHEPMNESISESSLNYSNIGLYDKLIQNENNKSQHLMALLKMREKALLDRTKGQIAWLEVQKARYKAKGLVNHIAAIKKKQRGIILKMEKEREEIKRLLQSTTNSTAAIAANTQSNGSNKASSQHNASKKYKKERLPPNVPLVGKPKFVGQKQTIKAENVNSAPILRGTYELESSQALEELLKKREEDLRKRREHVEHLMQWHQRLDKEEAEVLNLEHQLLNYNNVPHMVEQQEQKLSNTTTAEKLTSGRKTVSQSVHEHQVSTTKTAENKRASRARKMEKRLKEIDQSLRDLSHISTSSTTSGVMGQTNNEIGDAVSNVVADEVDFVRTTGMKLNKLWKRLTSQQIEKFESNHRYKLCKSDLEHLYEEAKMAVLKDFAENEKRIAQELLEKSASNLSSSVSPIVPIQNGVDNKTMEIPVLNLNFSSGHSEPEEESANNSNTNIVQQGNYSPSIAEQNFKAQELINSSTSSETSEQQTTTNRIQNSRLENNVQMFLVLSQGLKTTNHIGGRGKREGLQRSLSDTEISDTPKFKADKTTTSQKNIATVASQSNSSIAYNSSTQSLETSGQHQRSKSSIVEMTNIPGPQAQINNHTVINQTQTSRNKQEDKVESSKDLELVNDLLSFNISNRTSVICSVGMVTPIKCQKKSAEMSMKSNDLKSKSLTNDLILFSGSKQKSTYSGQVCADATAKAKEISNKLEDISAAVTKLSHMNALPSYESVTKSHLKAKSIEEPQLYINDDSNLSTDASSYSFNFENITTDKHSSPGTSTNTTNSLQNRTITSTTYAKKDDGEFNTSKESLSTRNEEASSTSLNSTKSKTFVKSDAQTITQTQSVLEDRILETYEADFESDLSNVTHIEDISIPAFETSAETTIDEEEDIEMLTKSTSNEYYESINAKTSDNTFNIEEINELVSPNNEKSLTTTIIKTYSKPSPDRELLPPPPPLPPPPITSAATATTTTANNQTSGNNLMPDIINELELRRHQLILDSEHLKQYEHVTAVPYMYVREIPNKPPPPYVPPAHGSPMTTIFPSEDRIKDITYRRTHELYSELLKTDYCNEKGEKLPSVLEEQITNIYERIILDICREYLIEHEEILRDGDPTNFHSQLAFFNPPNRLRCIQDAIYKEVRSCLAMDKTQPKRMQIYSVYGQRAKQDHIGRIIIQEMYDEDDRWCNFHREESEVLHLIVEEMINKNITEIAKEILMEEGGTIEEEELQKIIPEENEANHQFENSLDERKTEQETQLQSSILVETLNEENQSYCANETKQDYTVLNKTTTEPDRQESVNITNNSTTINAVQNYT